jgi:hypothetical protein
MRKSHTPVVETSKVGTEADGPTGELTDDKRRKCYMWYYRLGLPNRDRMMEKVAALKSCDITVEDVGLLPWIGGGATLSVPDTNRFLLND